MTQNFGAVQTSLTAMVKNVRVQHKKRCQTVFNVHITNRSGWFELHSNWPGISERSSRVCDRQNPLSDDYNHGYYVFLSDFVFRCSDNKSDLRPDFDRA